MPSDVRGALLCRARWSEDVMKVDRTSEDAGQRLYTASLLATCQATSHLPNI